MSLRTYIELFEPISDPVWERFYPYWNQVEFKRKSFLLQAGEIEKHLYFVKEGTLRGYHIKNGKDHVIGFAHKGTPCGVIDSFLTQKPSKYFLQALTDCDLWSISYEQLHKAYREIPELERWGRFFAEKLLVGIANRETSFLTSTADERFHKLMKRNPQILQLVPQRHLASYLGMSPETFSRLRAKMKLS